MKKINYRKVLAAALFIFLMMFFSVMFVACGSSKKNIEKESNESAITIKKDTSVKTNVATEEKVNEASKVSEEVSEETLEVEVKAGEELEITNFDANGNKTGSTKYTGSGKAKKSKSNKKTESNIEKESLSKTEASSQLESSSRTHATKALKKVKVEKDKKGFSFCTYLFWIILLIIVVVLWYLNKRFKWLFWLSNLFTNFFGI
jgi:Flp pilus assembly protein TadB